MGTRDRLVRVNRGEEEAGRGGRADESIFLSLDTKALSG